MKNRPIKELLQVLLDHTYLIGYSKEPNPFPLPAYFAPGLCALLIWLRHINVISEVEEYRVKLYMTKYQSSQAFKEYFGYQYSLHSPNFPYWMPRSDRAAREKWLKHQIENL